MPLFITQPRLISFTNTKLCAGVEMLTPTLSPSFSYSFQAKNKTNRKEKRPHAYTQSPLTEP